MKNIVGIVLPIGQNRRRLLERGQWSLWKSELGIYKNLGWDHELFEYRSTGSFRFLESLLLPVFERSRMVTCDILQAIHLSGSLPCMIAKILYGKPFILRYAYRYDEFARIERKWFQRVLVKLMTPLACRAASAVMVPTAAIAEFVKGQGATAVTVISNGVDTKLFRPALKAALKGLTLPKKGQTLIKSTSILSVGRFEPQKNLVRLIKAVHLIQTEGSDLFKRSDPSPQQIELTFIGQGSQQKVLGDTAEELGVSLNIIPPMSNDRLVSFYQQADIFVLPSLVEGHPKVLLEAMSCGLPVIASDIPGCTDIITDGVDGLLVEPSIKGIRDGLERLITNRSFAARLGKHAPETIAKRFEKRRVLEQEVQLMNQLA